MNPAIVYLLKTSLSLSFLYLFYWIFLRKETFFRFNRYYFLGSMALSLLIPLINIGKIFSVNESVPVRTISEGYVTFQNSVVSQLVPIQPEIAEKVSTADYLILAYILIASLMLLRLIFHTAALFIRARKASVIEISGTKVIPDKKVKSPYSFFSMIFVNPEQLHESNINEILLHEKEHIQQRHTIDLLIVELLTIFQWPNPFVWMLNKSIRETHEYLADHAVLKQGVSAPEYQKTLISMMMGEGNPALITPLNFSLNKKRIIMMNKMKSPSVRKWRSILLLPLVVILTLAFSSPSVSNENINSDYPTSTPKIEAKNEYLIKGIVTDSETGLPIPGVKVLDRDKMTETTTDSYGRYVLQIDIRRTSVIYMSNEYRMHIKGATAGEDVKVELQKKDLSEKPVLLLLYGKEITLLESMNIPAGVIERVEKIEGENAIKEYGEKGRNGVAKIILKDDCIQLKDMDLSKPIPRRIVIDEKELTKAEFLDLPHKRNYNFEEINGDKAVSKYGESARFGIFVGTSIPGTGKQKFSGKVIDKYTKQPLPGVSIILPQINKGTISDTQGRFEIVADNKTSQLSFSYLNYESVSVTLESSDNIVIELQKVATQKFTISGKVIDNKTGKPKPGVSVVVYGTTTGTGTDIDGKFSLNTSENPAKISLSFVGYESVVTNISNEEKPVIRLKRTILTIGFDNIPEPAQPEVVVNKNKPVFFVVESMPEYSGGLWALNDYITSNTNYPQKAKKQNITGTVFVNFTINKDGSVTDVYIDKNKTVNPLLDKEAVRVVTEMPDWKPAEQRGMKVPVQMSVPVVFKL
jgi:TonB family protein